MKSFFLFLIFFLAAFLIVFHFTDTPRVWVDEGVFTEVARNLAWHGVPGLQTEPGNFFPMTALLSTGYPVIFPVATSFRLFGTGIWQARLPMILYMFILAVLFYLYAKKRYGFSTAILSVLLLLSFSPFYGNGRPVQGEVPGLVFLVLGSWLLLFWEGGGFKSKKWALFSGMVFGLAASTKPVYLLVLSAALIITLLLWIKKIKNKKTVLFFGMGFFAPLILWIFIQFPTKDSLLQTVPLYLHIAGNHGSSLSVTQTILHNFIRFFTESTPILFLFLLVMTVISFLFRFFKKEDRNFSASECLILSFVILNWAGYLGGTGWYRYFFPAHTLLYLLFPAAILTLPKVIHKEAFKKIIFVIPAVLIIFQFFHLAFLSDTSFTVKRTRNTELSAALSAISPSQKVLFYNSIEAIIFLKGSNYSQYLSMGDFLEAGNKNALINPSEDFILTSAGPQNINSPLPCYEKKSVSRYYLFQKINSCEK